MSHSVDSDFRFYACTECGAMSMRNFRDDSCPHCRRCETADQITIYYDPSTAQLAIERHPAPHIEET